MILKIFSDVERLLNSVKINVPLTNSINGDITVIENSTAQGTVNAAGKDLGEHALFLRLAEYALSLNNVSGVKLNVLRSKLNNVYDYRQKRNTSQNAEYKRHNRHKRL